MSTRNLILLTISAALVGAVLAVVIGNSFASRNQESSPPLLARVEALENQLQQQQAKREELEGLVASLSRPQAQGVAASVMAERLQRLEQEREGEAEELDETEPTLITPQFSSQGRVTREHARKQVLIAGGFSEEEANWVSELESQVELDRLFEQHRWQREALAENAPGTQAWMQRGSRGNQLREKIGDDYYERYLKANGYPAAAEIRSVIKGSPAENAGLKAGDKIISYAGQRVFNMRDVSRLTLDGEEGEAVLLEVERDGTTTQLTIPRGPVGVSSAN